ncbi:immunity 70 family protein [Bacillus halotolerans]|uniref:immunity 70 family protein n=1 Tax=Bacillus halotolerans TaxID=260554 RepID=UPI003D208B19
MTVGFKVKYYWYQVGHGDFLHSFFSTVSYHLEEQGWGSKYPHLLNELYQGKLETKNIEPALEELKDIKERLKEYSPSQVVWDIEDSNKRPPWGDNISEDITDLSNYFVTCDGEDFISLLKSALEKGLKTKSEVLIDSI